MALTREALETRRERVRTLLLCGASIRKIAQTVQISTSAAQRDVEAVLKELRREQPASNLEAARARSLAVFRQIQQNAWGEIGRLDTANKQDLERLEAAEFREALDRFKRRAQKQQQQKPKQAQNAKKEDESNKLDRATIRAMHARILARTARRADLLKVIHACEVSITRIEGTSQPDVMSQTTINVLSLPEWTQARTAILTALASYPDARIAVADALAQVEAPNAAH